MSYSRVLKIVRGNDEALAGVFEHKLTDEKLDKLILYFQPELVPKILQTMVPIKDFNWHHFLDRFVEETMVEKPTLSEDLEPVVEESELKKILASMTNLKEMYRSNFVFNFIPK